jgi:hypothetical protein
MKFDALNVIELRENFVRQVISPLITRYPYEFGKELNIKVCLKRKDNHFFERVLGRSIDKGRLGSLFKLLLDDRYCELLYLYHMARKTYKMEEEKIFLLAVYKDVNAIFIMGDSNDNYRKHWDLVPLTVLKDNDNFQHQYRIDL